MKSSKATVCLSPGFDNGTPGMSFRMSFRYNRVRGLRQSELVRWNHSRSVPSDVRFHLILRIILLLILLLLSVVVAVSSYASSVDEEYTARAAFRVVVVVVVVQY